MTTFLPAEKGMTIRQPSTANLMLDSQDGPKLAGTSLRVNPWDFQITRPQALINGFFTRIGTTEVVLEWNYPNITDASGNDNNSFVYDISGGGGTVSIQIPPGNYTVAGLLLMMKDQIELGPGTMTINDTSGGPVSIEFGNPGQVEVSIRAGNLAYALGLAGPAGSGANSPYQPLFYLLNVDLRPFRYLDFVSQQLTYNQDLKDAATNAQNRDVLCRWYMDWDNPPTLDTYGFPILMGYTPFRARRLYNPPKQIRWDNIQPLGNLSFQVYTDMGVLVKNILYDTRSNWLMTLQISEC